MVTAARTQLRFTTSSAAPGMETCQRLPWKVVPVAFRRHTQRVPLGVHSVITQPTAALGTLACDSRNAQDPLRQGPAGLLEAVRVRAGHRRSCPFPGQSKKCGPRGQRQNINTSKPSRSVLPRSLWRQEGSISVWKKSSGFPKRGIAESSGAEPHITSSESQSSLRRLHSRKILLYNVFLNRCFSSVPRDMLQLLEDLGLRPFLLLCLRKWALPGTRTTSVPKSCPLFSRCTHHWYPWINTNLQVLSPGAGFSLAIEHRSALI